MGVVAALAASPAFAQTQNGGATVGVTAGTLGIGPEASVRASENIGVRGNLTFFSLSRSVDSDGINYDGDLRLRSGGAMLDLYPFGGGFRVSAGARVNGNRVGLRATPTENVEVGDETYTPQQIGTLSGDIKANGLAPTLTIGFGGGPSRGLKLGIEAGAMLQGSPEVRNLRATGSLASDPAFQQSLRDEEDEVEDDIKNFKLYPILQFSLGYRF